MKATKVYDWISIMRDVILKFSVGLSVVATLFLKVPGGDENRGYVGFLWVGTCCVLVFEGFLHSHYSDRSYPANDFSRSGMLPLVLIYLLGIAAVAIGSLGFIINILSIIK
jgi:hypothetical protein